MPRPADLIYRIVTHTPFPGWAPDAVYPIVADQLSRLEFDLLFPHGTESLIAEYQSYLCDQLSAAIQSGLPRDCGTTDKIRWMIRTHFQHIIRYSEAERTLVSVLHTPSVAFSAPQFIGKLTDIIWRAAGDKSTDMNYYSKRISLGILYSTTRVYWQTSNSDINNIMDFFNDRLENLTDLVKTAKKIPSPDNLIKNLKLLKHIFVDR